MPRRSEEHHYETCQHCQGTGTKQFFRKVGSFLRPIGNALKPVVRPLASELVNVGSTALKDVAPEYSGATSVGERVLSNSVDRGLQSKGYGVKRQGRLAKGSQEAKGHMARIRAVRGQGTGGKSGVRRMQDSIVMMPQPHSRVP